ncbi:MAG: class I SAM-dependent methyltransferase [Candidatus Margulisiibacteriota bacterium]
MQCPLCKSISKGFFEGKNGIYYACPLCKGIFLGRENLLSFDEEKERYLTHQNCVEDKGYQKFVGPIVKAVKGSFLPASQGLDFGCGQRSVIKHLLQQDGYSVALYDPFFKDERQVLSKKYDYIVCCEVIEHFHDPAKEFMLLSSMLKPKGKLFCMTETWDSEKEFAAWYYKNDPTHVFFYQQATAACIAERFGFSDHRIEGRLIELSKL